MTECLMEAFMKRGSISEWIEEKCIYSLGLSRWKSFRKMEVKNEHKNIRQY